MHAGTLAYISILQDKHRLCYILGNSSIALKYLVIQLATLSQKDQLNNIL